jgi:hypothetical protein
VVHGFPSGHEYVANRMFAVKVFPHLIFLLDESPRLYYLVKNRKPLAREELDCRKMLTLSS